jgi:hypothetical protein
MQSLERLQKCENDLSVKVFTSKLLIDGNEYKNENEP